MITSAVSLRITFLSKIKRTTIVFWQKLMAFFSAIVHAIGRYLFCLLIGIITESTHHQFTSLLLTDDAEIWYNTQNYTNNSTWFTP